MLYTIPAKKNMHQLRKDCLMLNPHSTAPAGSTFWGAAKREKSLRDVTVQMDIDSHLNGFIGNHGD